MPEVGFGVESCPGGTRYGLQQRREAGITGSPPGPPQVRGVRPTICRQCGYRSVWWRSPRPPGTARRPAGGTASLPANSDWCRRSSIASASGSRPSVADRWLTVPTHLAGKNANAAHPAASGWCRDLHPQHLAAPRSRGIGADRCSDVLDRGSRSIISFVLAFTTMRADGWARTRRWSPRQELRRRPPGRPAALSSERYGYLLPCLKPVRRRPPESGGSGCGPRIPSLGPEIAALEVGDRARCGRST